VGEHLNDRRGDPRYGWPPEDISQATLRPGCLVHVVDLSAGGALVQATRPLRPGSRLHFHLALRDRTFGLVAQVLRCTVWTLDLRKGLTYRGALQFEQRCEFFREHGSRIGSDIPAPLGTNDSGSGIEYPARNRVHQAFDSEIAE